MPARDDHKNDNAPLPEVNVVRSRKVVSLTPAATTALRALRAQGGAVEGKTQSDIARRLAISRTSYRRVIDRLETDAYISTSRVGQNYRVALAA